MFDTGNCLRGGASEVVPPCDAPHGPMCHVTHGQENQGDQERLRQKALQGATHSPHADLAICVARVQRGTVCGPVEARAVRHLGLLACGHELGPQLVHNGLALQVPNLSRSPSFSNAAPTTPRPSKMHPPPPPKKNKK
jgi:hypothetical protein